MADAVLIIGDTGCGKSTGIETLNPKETFVINPNNKPFPFPGWKKNYTVWGPENKAGNMYCKSAPADVLACMEYVSNKRPEIKQIVVDDFQFVSSFEFFDRALEKGYEKFTEIGAWLVEMARRPIQLREDLTIIFLTHVEEGSDAENKKRFKAKTIGKMVDEKLTLEALFTTVLYGKAKKNGDGTVRYVFETRNSGDNTCKTPRGMFPDLEIPNDLGLVVDAIHKYNNGDMDANIPAREAQQANVSGQPTTTTGNRPPRGGQGQAAATQQAQVVNKAAQTPAETKDANPPAANANVANPRQRRTQTGAAAVTAGAQVHQQQSQEIQAETPPVQQQQPAVQPGVNPRPRRGTPGAVNLPPVKPINQIPPVQNNATGNPRPRLSTRNIPEESTPVSENLGNPADGVTEPIDDLPF